jgi:putative membrane protein
MMLGYGMWWWGSLVWMVLLGGLVWALIANNGSRRPGRQNAVEILNERFARGEIDGETYRTTKIELERN